MNTDKRHVMRGMTLIEVSIALAVLGIASLGLAGTLVVSSNSNAISGAYSDSLRTAPSSTTSSG